MIFYKIFHFIIWIHLLTEHVLCVSFYAVTAPGILKSNRKYTVAVSLDQADTQLNYTEQQYTIRISIEGLSFNASSDVQLQARETKLIDFYPSKLFRGQYKLIAEGKKGLIFRNESQLLVDPEAGPNIYIQTDKAIYKPLDLIQFRIVILDEHTRPLKLSEPIRVYIADNKGNRVKQFKDIKLVKGVYTGRFQLSQRPNLGQWTIHVKITGKYAFESEKRFTVNKYTLPNFSLHIEAARHFVLQDEKIKAIIYGKYTFGRYVEGNATIQLWDVTGDAVLLQQLHTNIKTVASVEFHVNNTQEFQKNLFELKLVAILTDKYTGSKRSESIRIDVHRTRYIIEMPFEEIEYNNGTPYQLKVHVLYHSGSAVLDRQTPVIFHYNAQTYESLLDDNGVATFKFHFKRNENFKFVYKDTEQSIPDLFVFNEIVLKESITYCNLKLLTKSPQFGKPIEIEVSSLLNIPYLTYVLVGHGNIVRMEYIPLSSFTQTYIVRITPTIEMVPEAYFYVYYMDNGFLRSNDIKINIDNQFENKIAIIAPKQVKPGQAITFNLTAQPTSYVSILAVDLSVYLYDHRYDLDKQRILRDLAADKSYVSMEKAMYWPGLLSGLIVMTNAQMPFLSDISFVDNKGEHVDIGYRKEFPETWIFQNVEVNSSTTQLTFNLPDTITTWRITAFSNNEFIGFGIIDKPVDIISSKPFFISTNLPYSVKLGEILNLTVTVFNYAGKSLTSEVNLHGDHDEFQFIAATSSNEATEACKTVKVNSNSGEVVVFQIKPVKVGHITLRFTAFADTHTDAMIQKLKVEAQGKIESCNEAKYIKVDNNNTLSTKFSLRFPFDIIRDTEYVRLEIGSNYLTPSLENLHQLVKKPTGCGEQNMINFAPSVLILELLKAIGKYSEQNAQVKKLKSFIEIGYQQQLAYRHRNGGYSVFGEYNDEEASTWLTAYVMRFFIKASRYAIIENRIIETGLEYLSRQQLEDGSFPYTGYLFTPAQENIFGVTAFVLLTFLESHKYSKKYSITINNALGFLNTHADNIDDIYSLAIMAAVFKMAKNPKAKEVVEKLKQFSKSDDKGNKWWSLSDDSYEKSVEITAYIFIALLYDATGDYTDIAKWLIGQRNELGGFHTTHDTVLGLQALIKYYESYQTFNGSQIILHYAAKNKDENIVQKGILELNADNFEVLQHQELPKTTRQVTVEVIGSGHILVQLYYQYNIFNEPPQNEDLLLLQTRSMDALVAAPRLQHFLIKPQAHILNSFLLDLEICFTYQYLGHQHHINSTNMIILEANLPSGYRSNAENSEDLIGNDLIERIESKSDGTLIILYFDSLSVNCRHCINIEGQKLSDVINIQPVAITMYDYYNASRSTTVFYTLEMND